VWRAQIRSDCSRASGLWSSIAAIGISPPARGQLPAQKDDRRLRAWIRLQETLAGAPPPGCQRPHARFCFPCVAALLELAGLQRRRIHLRQELDKSDATACSNRPGHDTGNRRSGPVLACRAGASQATPQYGSSSERNTIYPVGMAIIVRGSCGARNRVGPIASGFPRCPRCKSELPWLVDADAQTVRSRNERLSTCRR
jgi:hypothetical protein